MDFSDQAAVTQLLEEVRAGKEGAIGALLPMVYGELQGLARAQFSKQSDGHTLQPTALVHEAWLKLAGHLGRVESRKHFYAVASQAMRQVLTDHSRGQLRQKRGANHNRVTLDESWHRAGPEGIDIVELDDLLTRLEALNPRHARVVQLRVLGGLTIAETAEVIDVSHSTIEADWVTARAWLRTKLKRA